MKDEELAKEYEEKAEYIEVDDYGKKRYDSIDIQRAFLAGLKAGRPQWHDLRKNKNDLPRNGRIVSDQEGNNVKYVEHLNEWFYRHITCKANVIAWCEIPTFDKE